MTLFLSDVLWLVACAAVALLIRRYGLSFTRIKGRSMLPTLRNKDVTLVLRLPYVFRAPRRQEVVICHYPGRYCRRCKWIRQCFVKRVIGLPGDTVEMADGMIYVNGSPLPEPYLATNASCLRPAFPPRRLGTDEYFVLGDNRDHSNDSRAVGPLSRRQIVGRVACVLLRGR